MQVTVLYQQSIFDLAVQQCGSADAALAIAQMNGKSITDELVVGEVLRVPAVVNRNVAMYYENGNLKPATALSNNEIIGRIFDNTFDITYN
jgi:hypothetical protein